MQLFCIVHAHTVHRHSHAIVLFDASGRKSRCDSPFMRAGRSRHTCRWKRNEVCMAVVICIHTTHRHVRTQNPQPWHLSVQVRAASLPCRSLCVSTETDVSRCSGLSGLRRGVEHASSASHAQTTRGAAHSEEPGLHNLGQCRWSHPDGEEGSHGGERRRHRPTWIPASSRSRILRLQLFWMR